MGNAFRVVLVFRKIKEFFGNTLYYPGCMTRYALKDIEENYRKLFKKIGLDLIEFPEYNLCCGSPVYHAGYKKDYDKLVSENKNLFEKHDITKVISNCPGCTMFLGPYYEKKNVRLNAKHATLVLWDAIKKGKLKLKKKKGVVTFHDPCHLGRFLGVYDEPREILKALGYEVREMRFNRENSACCGAGGGLINNNPEMAKLNAKKRGDEAKEIDVKVMVTCCPMCYHHLKENSGVEVKELSQVLIDAVE